MVLQIMDDYSLPSRNVQGGSFISKGHVYIVLIKQAFKLSEKD